MTAKTVSPDEQMDRSIESLIWAAASLVGRVDDYVKLDEELLNSRAVERLLVVENQMVHAYKVALRLRAAEVIRYAESLGFPCAEQSIRLVIDKMPLIAAVAIERFRQAEQRLG